MPVKWDYTFVRGLLQVIMKLTSLPVSVLSPLPDTTINCMN